MLTRLKSHRFTFNPIQTRRLLAFSAACMLSACGGGIVDYTPSEQETLDTLSVSKYQPATREIRNNIETQDLLAQAAFWSNEYNLNPADLESAIKLAATVRKLGNPLQAIQITQTTRALYPRDPYLIAEHAAALIASEQGQDAIPIVDEGLRIAPGYARLWSLKGAALDQVEQYDAARKHYARALDITPYDPNIMANLGLSFALSGDAVTAEKWLQKAAKTPGASGNVHQNLALVRQLQGKPIDPPTQTAAARKPTSSGYTAPSQPGWRLTPTPETAAQPQQRTTIAPDATIGQSPFASSRAARSAQQNTAQTPVQTTTPQVAPQITPQASAPQSPHILNRIARNVGPKPAPYPTTAPSQRQALNPATANTAQSQHVPTGYPPATYPAYGGVAPQALPAPLPSTGYTPPQRRGPARRR